MKFNRLELKGFMSHDHTVLDLSGIKTCSIIGANGSGKSTILDSIFWALFGTVGVAARLPNKDLVKTGHTSVHAILDFELEGKACRVERKFTMPTGKKTTGSVDLTFTVNGQQVAQGDQEQAEIIVKYLGAPKELIVQSIAVVQGQLSSFLTATSADRRDLIQRMLLLDRYTRAAILAKEAWSNAVAENRSRHMTLQAFEDQLKAMQPEEEINARIAEFGQAVTAFDQQVEEIRIRREGLVAQDREYRTLLSNLESQVVRAQDLLTKKTIELDQDLRELESSIKSAEAEIATIPQFREMIQRLEADTKVAEIEVQKIQLARGRQQELTRTLQQQQQRMLVASQMVDTCPLCKEKISAERRQAILAEMQAETAQVSSELSAIEQALQLSARVPAPAQLRAELEQTQSRLARTETKIVTRQELVGRLATAKEKRIKVLQELSNDLTDLSQRVDTTRAKLNAEVETLANQIEAIKVQRVPFSKQLESWSNLKLNRKSTEENRDLQIQYLDASKAQESEVEFVAEALAPAGIPLMIIDSYLPLIEARARELLAKMSDGALDLKMAVVEAGAKKGIDLFAGAGVLRPIRALSGGEQTRVALAVRLALSRMLTETSGSNFDCLVIDEPEYLDGGGVDQLIQTIDRLQDQFSQIFVISHHPALRQAFARTISVEKVNGSSQVKVL